MIKRQLEHRGIKAQYNAMRKTMNQAVLKAMESGDFIEGEQVKLLEELLSKEVGVKHCITCGNGTDALFLILKSLNIGAGDAVIVPAFTYIATAEAVVQAGATPVFVDVDMLTYNISLLSVKETMEKIVLEGKYKIKAIIGVDLFGLPADYYALQPLLEEYNLLYIEDGAQGFGGRIGGRKALSFGVASALSFFPTKPLGAYGDGGAVFTNDSNIAEFIRSYKCHGMGEDKYHNKLCGINSRLDTIQASVLIEKLKVFKKEQSIVRLIVYKYNKALGKKYRVPFIPVGFTSSYAQYTIRCKNNQERDGLLGKLKILNIPATVYYKVPLHLQEAFSYLGYSAGDFPVSELLSKKVLSIPIHPYFSRKEINTIIKMLTI